MSQWQQIETAPQGVDVLLFYPDLKTPVTVGHYSVTENFENGVSVYRDERWWARGLSLLLGDIRPTHWMPLPEPPHDPR